MTVKKRGLRLGKREFTDVAWQGELMVDLKALKFRRHRIGKNIEKRMRDLHQLEANFNIEKKCFVDAINDLEGSLEQVLVFIEEHEKAINKLNPKKKVKAKPVPKPKPVPVKPPAPIPSLIPKKIEVVAAAIKESLEETIEDITEEIEEHQEKTIRAVKAAVNGHFAQTVIEGKILCPECINAGKQEAESLFTKGGAFISHYKSHFKNGNGVGDV